jgi:hypothetical protein
VQNVKHLITMEGSVNYSKQPTNISSITLPNSVFNN